MADLFSYPEADAKRHKRSIARENKQFASRWSILRFHHEIPEAERNVVLEPCGCCCAKWYGEVAARVLAEGPPRVMSSDSTRRVTAPAPDPKFAQLQQLMMWARGGMLTQSEFAAAKRQLDL